MNTYKELMAKWDKFPERDLMSIKEELEYIHDWYNLGKNLPTKPFEPTFTDYVKYKGQSFTIIDEVKTFEVELEQLPMWKIKMEDGTILWALCDEIFKIEN